MRHGNGILTMPDKSRYEGWYGHQGIQKPTSTKLLNICMLALLATLHPYLHATGGWSENKMHGEGFYTYANGDMYTGIFQQGTKHGTGSYYFKVALTTSLFLVQNLSWVPTIHMLACIWDNTVMYLLLHFMSKWIQEKVETIAVACSSYCLQY